MFFSNFVRKTHGFLRYSTCKYTMTLTPGLGSLKVIENDTIRSSTHDFLLTFHSNHRLISHRFRDKRRFPSKIAIFPPRYIYTPPEGVPVGIGYRRRDKKKLEWWGYQMVVSFKICLVVLIQYGRVTDRRTASHVAVASTALASVEQVQTKIRTFDLRFLGFF